MTSTLKARVDLYGIWDFIGDDSPEAADRVADDIVAAIAALVPFPRQGHRRPDLTSPPLRFIRVHDYLIAYAPEEEPLWRAWKSGTTRSVTRPTQHDPERVSFERRA
jgi:plasmid stabilization system protein ParE